MPPFAEMVLGPVMVKTFLINAVWPGAKPRQPCECVLTTRLNKPSLDVYAPRTYITVMNCYRSENIVGTLALTLSDILLQVSQAEAPSNITAAGLTLIGHVPGLSIHDLSRGLSLSHPGTVRLVDRMAADGLVTRTRSDSDGRAVALVLTPMGEARERAVLASRQAALSQALACLTTEEHTALAQISEKIITSLLRDESHALQMCRLCNSKACVDCPVEAELDRQAAH